MSFINELINPKTWIHFCTIIFCTTYLHFSMLESMLFYASNNIRINVILLLNLFIIPCGEEIFLHYIFLKH